MNSKLILIFFSIITVLVGFGVCGKASAATYYATGTLVSTNLLSGLTVNTIDSFYTSSTIPIGTSLWMQFSTTSATWYSADGTLNGTTTVLDGQATTSLATLGWSGPNFYYKITFDANTTKDATPVLDEIRANYNMNASPNAPTSLAQYKSDCSTSISTGGWTNETSVCFKGYIDDSDTNDNVKLQVDYTTGTFNNIVDASSTAWCADPCTVSTTISGLSHGSQYKWQANAIDDGEATSSWSQFNSGNIAFGVDTSAPTLVSVTSITESTGQDYQYASGTNVIYYNTATSSGSFIVNATATDSESGIEKISFPDTVSVGENDTSDPYSFTYSWDNLDTFSQSATITAYNNAGSTTTASFNVNLDTAAPSGGSITYTDGYSTSTFVSLIVADGTDSDSGLNTSTRTLQRKEATLSGGSCGGYESWSTISPSGSYPNFTDSTVQSGKCYQYQYLVSDNVSNQATYTTSNTAKIDTSVPSSVAVTSITEGTASDYQYASGTNVIYYNTATSSGSFIVNATGTDSESGIQKINFPTTVSAGGDDDTEPYSFTYNWDNSDTFSQSATITAYNNAGSTTTASFNVNLDTTAPSGGSITYTDGYYTATSVSITYALGSDSGSGLDNSTGKIQRKEATLSGGSCGSYGSWSDLVTEFDGSYTDTSVVSDKCYQYQYLISDNVSNQATNTTTNTAKIDTEAPTISGTPSATSPTSDNTPTWTWTTSTDSGSGLHSTEPYTVQWCQDSNFTGCDANTSTISTNSFTHSTALADGTWYFRTKAKDAVDNESAFSSNGSVVVDTTVSTTPSGGGGMPVEWYNPPKPPERGFAILVNNNAEYTNNLTVTLNLRGGSDTARMVISNFSDFRDAGQETYAQSKEWNLCKGLTSCPEGEYRVYVKFYASWGKSSEVISDSIIFRKGKPLIEKIKEIPKKVVEEIKEIPEKIIEIIKPKPKPPEEKPSELPPVEEVVKKEAPLALQGKWQLLPSEPIREFVLAPLPKEIIKLAEKFPELGETLKKVGITKITDIEKLKAVKLTLPGLTETVGLPTTKIEPGKFALPKAVPVAELSPEVKQELPTDIVFAKTGGELIDFNIALTVTEKGESEQKITTISGKPLQLVVKPDQPVKSVKGYVVFKSKPKKATLEIPLNYLLGSVFFASPIFAKEHNPKEIETRLVLLEFEYADPDGDGIYTAEIQAPVVDGEYEIITVMDYEDPELGTKEIRLTTVVDPEGYIFEKGGNKETRIPGAIVSLFWLNPETKQYEVWPAKEYQQENPQTTDVRGTYSFLAPEGYYYLKAEAPGYLVYDGKPFQVKEGSGIHINIELKTKYWWLKIVDWKTILLVAVIILLLYNFYRDKIREKLLKSKNL